MDGVFLSRQSVQALEDGVDVSRVLVEVEDRVERGAVEPLSDLRVAADELGEVALLLPGAQRVNLHEPVGLVARQAGLDEGEQKPLAEEEAVACLEVPPHPIGPNDETLDEPGEAVEHVVEREEGVRN